MSRVAKMAVRDARLGFRRTLPAFLLFSLLLLVQLLSFDVRTSGRPERTSQLGVGDGVCVLLYGSDPFAFNPSDPFRVPALWLLLVLAILYASLRYASSDFEGPGIQIILSSGSRWGWWLSKCFWCAACPIAFALLILVVSAGYSLCSGGGASLDVSASTFSLLGNDRHEISVGSSKTALFLLSFAISAVALSLLQLAVSYRFGFLSGFLVSGVVVLASVFAGTPIMLGNSMMFARSALLSGSAVGIATSFAVPIVVSALSVLVGGLCFKRMDLMGGDQNDDRG